MGYRTFFLTTLFALSLEANPLEPTVTAGHATCTASGQNLEVAAHDKTIISWKDFSIGQNEMARFNLPGKDAVILNRVSSDIPSKIEGLLSSNGIVYLINPNGILITSTGTINTAGFLASTLNITDQDFLNGGDLLFKGSGSVTHLGAIKCHGGDVVLMASQIKNEGTIEAGSIDLTAGEEIVMTLSGDEKFMVRNTGSLESFKTELKADGNLYAYAIQNEGSIQATATTERAGRIYLVAEKGHVNSSGTLTAPGGEVRVLGQTTSLTGEAKIDVSGETGGTILVGGDYQGKNPDILNADYNFVDPQVTIKADSLGQGNGGKVIFWSNEATHFYGSISAQGGPLGGDGGFVEVSGDYLDYQGLTNLLAPLGKIGTLLLDPITVIISNGADTGTFNGCPAGTYTYVSPTTVINITNLETHLATCNVTIDSTGAGAGDGTITIANSLTTPPAPTTLTLIAGSNITVNLGATLTNGATSGGGISFTTPTNRFIALYGPYIVSTAGSSTFTAGGGFGTNSITTLTPVGTANFTINAFDIGIVGALSLQNSNFTATATGSIVGDPVIQLNGPVSFTGNSTVVLTATVGNITLSSTNMTVSGSGPLTVTAGAILALNATINYSSTAPCIFKTTGSSPLTSDSVSNMSFAAGCGPVTLQSMVGAIDLVGSMSFAAPNAGTLSITAANGLTLGDTTNGLGPITYNTTSSPLTLTATAGGITINSPVTVTSTASLDMMTVTGDISINNQVLNTSTGPINVTSAGSLLVGSAAPIVAAGPPCQIGSALGDVTISTVNDVFLYAPGSVGSYAQIGYHMGDVSSNLHFTNIGRNLILSGSQGSDSNTAGYALIGHGSTTQPGGIRNGNILFSSIGGVATVQFSLESPSFTSSNTGNYFAQIGHARSFMTSPVVATGDITFTSVAGSISVTGEITDNSYALIGHGGGLSSQPDTYSGSILLNAGTDITLATRVNLSTGITPPNAFAIIGHTALMNGAGTVTSHSDTIQLTAVDGIILKSERGNVSAIGPYVNTMGTAGASGAVSVGTFIVNTGSAGNLVLSSVAPNTGDPLTAAFVGPVSCTGALPLTAAGSATSTLTVNIAKDLQLQTGSTGSSSNTFTLIQDGMGAASGGATITVGGKATLFGGNNSATINGGGVLNLNITGPLTLLAGPTGNAQITGSAGGTILAPSLSLAGVIGGGAAQIQNTSGSLSITSSSELLTLSDNANITQTGTGTLTVTATLDDLVMQNLASISNLGSGSTMIRVGGVATLLAGQGNATMINGTGSFTLNVTDNLNLSTNAGGSSLITSNGPMTITAQNVSLFGIGAGQQSAIRETAGNMLIQAMNDIVLDDNALIANTGGGTLTLVVDNQAPASVGTGRFILAPDAMVTGSGLTRIFTAQPNGIGAGNLAFGQVNGSYVTAGLACAFDAPPPSSTAQYSTFYPSTFGGTPYTIFFKSPLTPAAFKMRSR